MGMAEVVGGVDAELLQEYSDSEDCVGIVMHIVNTLHAVHVEVLLKVSQSQDGGRRWLCVWP